MLVLNHSDAMITFSTPVMMQISKYIICDKVQEPSSSSFSPESAEMSL